MTFSTDARLWLAITTASADAASRPTEVRTPAQLPPPLIRQDGLIALLDAELYIASVLHGAGAAQIRSAYAYSTRSPAPRHPGVGLLLADGGRAYLPIAHTASADREPGRRPFRQLQELL